MKTLLFNLIWIIIAPIAFLLGVLSLIFNFLAHHLRHISNWLFVLIQYIGIKIDEM